MPALTSADLEFLGIIFLSYVIGSLSPSYLAGRMFGGVDLRRHGTGNVGGANVYTTVGRWLVVPVGILEVAKGACCVLIARAAGFDAGGQMLAGVCALVGHNWSLFLGFQGGRGTGVMIGVLLLLAPLQLFIFATAAILGLALRITPLGVLLGLALVPLSALIVGDHISVFLGSVAILVIILAKRVVGNRGWDPSQEWPRLVLLRLLLDRDVRRREDWVARRPPH